MSEFPSSVEFHEEGPREGFQMEKTHYPLEQRKVLIELLAESGLKQIQVGSFVSTKAVPTMADTAELFAAIDKKPGTRYTSLWLNEAGFRRAVATPGITLDGKILVYTTDEFCLKNNNCTVLELREKQKRWLELYDNAGVPFEQAYIITAFGCNYEGEVAVSKVVDAVRFLEELCSSSKRPLPHIYLADTVGWANPESIKRRISAVRNAVPAVRIGTHLHDTRGLGAANVYAALQMGVDLFDSSVAGLGGCPFAKHANSHGAGNICTEDMVFMCHELGIKTGINLEILVEAALFAERMIGRPLAGKLMHAGIPRKK
ncbi:hydroxymethylglutaryl-CoA lyase [Bradyrhizobium sp. UNPF46]|uniref:hydroxymethylglutaryl-CoA lyase n=1 Tax=Bradyrhizobium sp. UNPF46 TaxID=1141168 RepID=UPI00114FAF38|nr:hydroxymethylglutaryl-CoA lyase [Bradyrhizobium sp. UNPF46]TQF27594.1 hydroxymethylglutaryl-CoA lyase [Bradyrhizobium sp. UNPF46]